MSNESINPKTLNLLFETMGSLDENNYTYFASYSDIHLVYRGYPKFDLFFYSDGIVEIYCKNKHDIFDCTAYPSNLPERRERLKSTIEMLLSKTGANIKIPEFDTHLLKY